MIDQGDSGAAGVASAPWKTHPFAALVRYRGEQTAITITMKSPKTSGLMIEKGPKSSIFGLDLSGF